MRRERRVRVGVLGCSDIATRKFLPGLRKAANAELAAVASRDRRRAAGFGREHGCAGVSYEDLLTSPDVDLVYISLPNHLHEEWTLATLANGKHVLCEKPLGLSPGSVERMHEEARRRGLVLFENLTYLHHPLSALVKEMIDTGTIGNIVSLRAAFGFTLPRDHGFRQDPDRGGGAFYDLARYPLSTALCFLRGTEFRFAGFSWMRGGLSTGLTVSAATSAGEGFSFTIGFEQQYECWYELVGDRGKLRVDRAYTAPADREGAIEVTAGRERTMVTAPAADQWTLMIEHVCGLALRGEYDTEAGNRALRLARLAEQVQTSCTTIDRRAKLRLPDERRFPEDGP